MTKHLLAAEADKIQDLIFRSSRLREVVGGSQLLSRFCEEVPTKIDPQADVITRGGASFRVEFEGEQSEESALRFGAALAEVYNRATGGTLSVAEPVDSTKGYGPASDEAGEKLRQAKRMGKPIMVPQIPYMAFCESCGTGLALAHVARPDEDEKQYVCTSCLAKSQERLAPSSNNFLEKFYLKVVPDRKTLATMRWPHCAEEVGRYDDRGCVAYIVADGDSLGRVFRECDREQARKMSKVMDDVLRKALADPLSRFLPKQEALLDPWFMPVLPLILGGDDLFALVPAPWALDIAQHLCTNFQREMTRFADREKIKVNQKKTEITMTAAVVICKSNYPYYLAHQIGERRLSGTKRVVKALAAAKRGGHFSAVDFEVVMASQVERKELTGMRRSTMRPYWLDREDGQPILPGWGLPLSLLLDWRYQIARAKLPSRRLSQLRAQFDPSNLPGGTEEEAQARQIWNNELERILKRIERDWMQKGTHPVRAALRALTGGEGDREGVKLAEWYGVKREGDGKTWYGHGMPDLLRVWDWALRLDLDPEEYRGGER